MTVLTPDVDRQADPGACRPHVAEHVAPAAPRGNFAKNFTHNINGLPPMNAAK